MRRYNTQISDLIALSIKSSSTAVLPPFFRYLTEKVKSIHYRDLQLTPVEEIEGTYDPCTGTAYYFTASGNQLRKMPQYEKILRKTRTENLDEIKTVGKFILLFRMVGTRIFYCGSVLFMGIPTDSILSMV